MKERNPTISRAELDVYVALLAHSIKSTATLSFSAGHPVLNAEKVDGISIVQLPEKINSTNSRAFQKDLAPLMEENSRFVFDMSRLTQLDGMGLGSIVSCVKRLRNAGGDLKLYGMSKQIRTLFQLVRMHHVVDIFNTGEEALESYK